MTVLLQPLNTLSPRSSAARTFSNLSRFRHERHCGLTPRRGWKRAKKYEEKFLSRRSTCAHDPRMLLCFSMLREVKMKAEFLVMSIMLALSIGGALLFEMWKVSLCQSGGQSIMQCIVE